MNHNEFKKRILLSLFGELSDSEQSELETHLHSCRECRSELEKQKNILSLVSQGKKLEVDDNLILEARAQLRGAIRGERKQRNFIDESIRLFADFITVPYRASLSGLALLLVGFLIGYLFFGSSTIDPNMQTNQTQNGFSLLENDITITNIRFIDSEPSDGEVEFTFEAVKPIHLKGEVNDPKIQGILTYAMLNERNPGARLNSINAMDSEGSLKFDKDIKDALITVVMTDKNPGVRREALKLINKFPYDEEIKQAYIYVLTTDTSSGLRIEAINALLDASKKGLNLNQDELDLFRQKFGKDENPYIRYRTKTILQEYN